MSFMPIQRAWYISCLILEINRLKWTYGFDRITTYTWCRMLLSKCTLIYGNWVSTLSWTGSRMVLCSLKEQIVCEDRQWIMHITAQYSGHGHDAFILWFKLKSSTRQQACSTHRQSAWRLWCIPMQRWSASLKHFCCLHRTMKFIQYEAGVYSI